MKKKKNVEKSTEEKKKISKNEFKVLSKYIKKEKFSLTIYLLLTFFCIIPSICIPYLFGSAWDLLVVGELSSYIVYIMIACFFNIFSYCFVSLIMNMLYYKMEKRISSEIFKDLYTKVNDLPAIAFEDLGVGEITNRLQTDPNTVVELFFAFVDGIYFIVKTLIIFIVIFNISFVLGMEAFIFTFTMFFISKYFMPKIKKYQKDLSSSGDEFSKMNTENLQGIREIKSLGIKKILSKKVFDNVDDYTKKRMDININENYFYCFNNTVFYLFQIIIFATMGNMYVNGAISIAIYMMIQNHVWNLDYAATKISKMGTDYSKISVSLGRINDILSNKLYEDEKFGDKVLKDVTGNLEFNSVNFKYKDEEDYVLKDFTAAFKPNVKNAVVGKSGNGKSTLFNLLLRYFDSTEGTITIDGTNIKDLEESSLRSNISVIRQQPFLFNETIRENFKIVKPDVTDEEIIDVCKKAYIHDYITGLKLGYDTVIGEGGVNLSGGQKQRIAIARTLLLNTKIILFDEATSALDNEAQEYIKKTIDNLVKDHTVIIIAHRLSTIVDADKIFVVNEGTITASGTHKELVKNNDI